MSEHDLKGRAAWVTGGASGMGRAIALALAELGADIAIGSLLAEGGITRPTDVDTYFPTAKELETIERVVLCCFDAASAERLRDALAALDS